MISTCGTDNPRNKKKGIVSHGRLRGDCHGHEDSIHAAYSGSVCFCGLNTALGAAEHQITEKRRNPTGEII